MDPYIISRKVIPALRDRHLAGRPSIYLTISTAISEFNWHGGNLEALIERILKHVFEISTPARSVRIAVHEKKRMADLEQFFCIVPRYWFHLGIESQAVSGFENGIRRILESSGYHCPEWIGVEGSTSQLGAFYLETQQTPALVLFIQSHGARNNCDILIPVMESASCLAHAV
jgi:hypothetical protein